LSGASAIARDISQRKRTEEALRRNERLATAGRLTAAIAHEIRNPLEALINLVYLSRRDAAGRDEYLRLAEQEIGRLDSIAQQALGFVPKPRRPSALMQVRCSKKWFNFTCENFSKVKYGSRSDRRIASKYWAIPANFVSYSPISF